MIYERSENLLRVRGNEDRPFLSNLVGRTLSILKLYLRIQQRQTMSLYGNSLTSAFDAHVDLHHTELFQYKAEWYTKGIFSLFYY